MYDVEIVYRILVCFLKRIEDEECNEDDNEIESLIDFMCYSLLFKVGLIIDVYLVEIVLDLFLSLNKFIDLIEILLDYVCVMYDGFYRVIDMFFKVINY